MTNYSTNISSQKDFFAKLNDKYPSPKSHEEEAQEVSFIPEPMIDIDLNEEDEVTAASLIEKEYMNSRQ